ncbi:MAG: SprT-like domain-containing protein [Terriglobales bacterium]
MSDGPFVPCPVLQRLYAVENRRWFGGRLPRAICGWRFTGHYKDGRTTQMRGDFVISVAPRLWGHANEARMTLLHEMAHVSTWARGGRVHGRAWRLEMRRLARVGAMDRWW